MMAVERDFPQYRFVIAGAPGMDSEVYSDYAGETGAVITGATYNLLKCAEAAIVNSGTATLETALIGTRQIVVYDVFGGRLANMAKPIILRMGYASLVNIILGREVVKELLAGDFTAENVRKELYKILNDDRYKNTTRDDYDRLRKILGGPGAAERCAEYIVEYLRKKAS
jgi:lipid-A-disaccharide synthase